MALIQFDIPDELNKKVRLYSIDKECGSREDAVLKILEERFENEY